MTITALLLVITAAFCHATWNFYVKRIGSGARTDLAYINLIKYILFAGSYICFLGVYANIRYA